MGILRPTLMVFGRSQSAALHIRPPRPNRRRQGADLPVTPRTVSLNEWPMYHYRARLMRVIDGDTVRAVVDLGMRITREISLRIQDIDAPEVFGSKAVPEGATSSAALYHLVADRQLYVATEKDKKSFDRYVAHLFIDAGNDILTNVGTAMVELGYADRV